MTFRRRLFWTSALAATLTLAVAAGLISWTLGRSVTARIERSLVAETRLAAETLSHRRAGTRAELDAEADAIGALVDARVTFVAPDGAVVGDSELSLDELRHVENHATRPEIQQARRDGLGVARRHSATIGTDMLYVAVPVRNPDAPDLSEVRLALPLTDVREQLATVRRAALVAFAVGLVAALALAWAASVLLARRVHAIAARAERYARGDLSPTDEDLGDDEIATVARVLDESVREVGRRAAELTADRARAAAILAGMIEGVLVVDSRGRLQMVNAAARRMLRIDTAPEGRHYLEAVRHPDIGAQISGALHGQATDGRELALAAQPGSTFIARSAPLQSMGGGAVVVLHDITDLRRADQMRRDFVANVSHELRTPLTAVRGYVEALLDGAADDAQRRTFLETIARHTLRMERLVRDLLRLARLDARQETPDVNACSVAGIFNGAVGELAGLIEARGQRVEQHIGAGAETVRGDAAKLQDALRNLVENAAHYSPEGSTIRLGSSRDGDRVLLTVADEGPGIPPADLDRVFERFYRVDKARARDARDPGGTGLGLAIVKHLAGLHGGTVKAANRPGRGALFTIDLPADAREDRRPT